MGHGARPAGAHICGPGPDRPGPRTGLYHRGAFARHRTRTGGRPLQARCRKAGRRQDAGQARDGLMTTRAGFAAIIGAPNAGKSTLTNRLVGAKVSIVTQKVQTTRFPVRGVAMAGDAQSVLVDTPGIFAPRRRLDRAMIRAAWGGAEDADAIVHLVDTTAQLHDSPADRKAKADVETI